MTVQPTTGRVSLRGVRRMSKGSDSVVMRVLRRPLGIIAVLYLCGIISVAVLAPVFLPDVAHEQAGDLGAVHQGPTSAHIMGTDTLGRDVLQRLMVGARPSMLGVAEALIVAVVIAVPAGVASAYFGRWVDRVAVWLADLLFSMPGIILVLAVVSVYRQNLTAAMVTLGIIGSPGLMRIVRSAALAIRNETYVEAASVTGLSGAYIMRQHILPRIAGPVIVQTSLLAGVILLVQTGLGFLGVIVRAPAPSWGSMVADGMGALSQQPWLIWPPGIVITLTVLAFGVLGDVLRDATTASWASVPAVRPSPRRVGSPSGEGITSEIVETSSGSDASLLVVSGLGVEVDNAEGARALLDDVSFEVAKGETLGIVGESGCGKSTLALAILGILPSSARIVRGSVRFDSAVLSGLSEKQLNAFRGRRIGFISQDPMVSLNPAFRVGWQLAEAARFHLGLSKEQAEDEAIDLLEAVQLPDPVAIARRYPHELSGGMAQRVGIARALAGRPELLIADEPTTALDVTVQSEVLDLLSSLQSERDMSMILISHDFGVIRSVSRRAMVMYAGQVVESGPTSEVLSSPKHPYTSALMAADPHYSMASEYLPTVPGTVPSPGNWPAGCHFHPRCRFADESCRITSVVATRIEDDRTVRCIKHGEIAQTELIGEGGEHDE